MASNLDLRRALREISRESLPAPTFPPVDPALVTRTLRAARRARRRRSWLTVNQFCATGPGGGIDPTCSKDRKGANESVNSVAESSAQKTAELFGFAPVKVKILKDESGRSYGEFSDSGISLVNIQDGAPVNRQLNMKIDRTVTVGEHLAAHEVAHLGYVADPDLGRTMMERLKQVNAEYGSSVSMYGAVGGGFENLMELAAVYSHSPESLKRYSPEMHKIAEEWTTKVRSRSRRTDNASGDELGDRRNRPVFGDLQDRRGDCRLRAVARRLEHLGILQVSSAVENWREDVLDWRFYHTQVVNYSPDQERDETGRWSRSGGRGPTKKWEYRGWITPEGGHISVNNDERDHVWHVDALKAETDLKDVTYESAIYEHGYARVEVNGTKTLYVDTHYKNLYTAKRWVQENVDPAIFDQIHYTTFGHADQKPREQQVPTANSSNVGRGQFSSQRQPWRVTIRRLAPYLLDLMPDLTKGQAAGIARSIQLGLRSNASDSEVAEMIEGYGIEPERAALIARTEMARARADTELGNLRPNERVVYVLAPDACPKCVKMQRRYGERRLTAKQAQGIIPVHPNCYCRWKTVNVKSGREVTRNEAGADVAILEYSRLVENCGGPGSGRPGPCPERGSRDSTGGGWTLEQARALIDELPVGIKIVGGVKERGSSSNDLDLYAGVREESAIQHIIEALESLGYEFSSHTEVTPSQSRVARESGKKHPRGHSDVFGFDHANGQSVDLWVSRPHSKSGIVDNVFCATGEGGGVDPGCSSGGSKGPALGTVEWDIDHAEKIAPNVIERTRAKNPLASDPEFRKGLVSGLEVTNKVPNTDSISATFDDQTTTELGVREVPMTAFDDAGDYRAADDNAKVDRLVSKIKENGWISPLIVVADHETRKTGKMWVLEGGHRIRALQKLGVKSIPALVVVDHTEPS